MERARKIPWTDRRGLSTARPRGADPGRADPGRWYHFNHLAGGVVICLLCLSRHQLRSFVEDFDVEGRTQGFCLRNDPLA